MLLGGVVQSVVFCLTLSSTRSLSSWVGSAPTDSVWVDEPGEPPDEPEPSGYASSDVVSGVRYFARDSLAEML